MRSASCFSNALIRWLARTSSSSLARAGSVRGVRRFGEDRLDFMCLFSRNAPFMLSIRQRYSITSWIPSAAATTLIVTLRDSVNLMACCL